MAEACDLVWATLCDGSGAHPYERNGPQSGGATADSARDRPRDEDGNGVMQEPIRALVGRQSGVGTDAKRRDTFLVATGKGKVRAGERTRLLRSSVSSLESCNRHANSFSSFVILGIFSRHHLLTTGLEAATALPLLCEARDRGMNCVLIDPNARGDRHGMATFEVSMRRLFFEPPPSVKEGDRCSEGEETIAKEAVLPEGAIDVLAHSAAGGQLVRYFMQREDFSRIRGVAFTDSTHSVQWLKKHAQLSSFVQSPNALYVKSANPMRDHGWKQASAGDACPRDDFWIHRFGSVRTVWAGECSCSSACLWIVAYLSSLNFFG